MKEKGFKVEIVGTANTSEQISRAIKAQTILQNLEDQVFESLDLLSAEDVFALLREILVLSRNFFGQKHWDFAYRNPEVRSTGQITPSGTSTEVTERGTAYTLLLRQEKWPLKTRHAPTNSVYVRARDVADEILRKDNIENGGRPESKKIEFHRTLLPQSPKIQGLIDMTFLLWKLIAQGYLESPREIKTLGAAMAGMNFFLHTLGLAPLEKKVLDESLRTLIPQDPEQNKLRAQVRYFSHKVRDLEHRLRPQGKRNRGTKPNLRLG